MKNILHDLYFGRISGWERRPVRTLENMEVNRKIESEKMSLDDVQRFQALENLYASA